MHVQDEEMRTRDFLLRKAGLFNLIRARWRALSGAEGFTLIELVLAVGIGAVLLSGAVLSIYQVLVTTDHATDQVVALADINSAALAIRNDLLMAMTTDLSSTPQSSANLTWFDYTSSFGTGFQTDYNTVYTLSGKELRRFYNSSTNYSIVGRNVTSLSFTQSEKLVTVVISTSNTTRPSGTETLRFTVHLRPEEIN